MDDTAEVDEQETASTEPPSRSPSRSRNLEHTTTNPDLGDRAESDSDDESFSRKISRASGRNIDGSIRRRETVLSKIRSRPLKPQFTHPLENVQTSIDELVEFDGPDDPYRPVNWSMKKKIITTALYGMTTMVASWASATYSAG
jgi:MFS transporter, DHA1 family, multidrug resistance protein